MWAAFKKVNKDGLLGRAINQCTGRIGYCHVELMFSDLSYFSSVFGTGCRFTHLNINDGTWDLVYIPLHPSREALVKAKALQMADRPNVASALRSLGPNRLRYDWRGVLGFVSPLKADPHRVWCSRACTIAVQAAGVLKFIPNWVVNPDNMSWLLQAYYEAVHNDPRLAIAV